MGSCTAREAIDGLTGASGENAPIRFLAVRGWSAFVAAGLGLLVLPAGAFAALATIRRTAHGIPHIEAKNYRGIGYGYGYAFAQDDICPIAEAYVTGNAKRSRWFGPDGTYQQPGNSQQFNNLNSDFFWKQVIDSKAVENLLAQRPPKGPKQAIRQG